MKEKAKGQKHFVEERCFHTKPLEESQTAEGLTHQIQAHYVSRWKTKLKFSTVTNFMSSLFMVGNSIFAPSNVYHICKEQDIF